VGNKRHTQIKNRHKDESREGTEGKELSICRSDCCTTGLLRFKVLSHLRNWTELASWI